MPAPETTLRALAAGASDRAALLAPGREPLSFAALEALLVEATGALAAFGVRAGDRVALVTSNGPEAATAFLSIACVATCAPLNPAYRASELDWYLGDLRARAVVVAAALDSPVREVAARRGIPVIELAGDGRAAGAFRLRGVPDPVRAAAPHGDDVALVLHTSGTTGRPKLVPLSHRNLVASARRIARHLRLGPDDRCLNVMPLFHIHGLVGALLSSLSAGASVACTAGLDAPAFFDHLRTLGASWYTAVPTMHQAVLARARIEPNAAAGVALRLVRSASAPLAPPVLAELERLFSAPVLEAYGMTEGSHQICANPLPPAARKPGSVGLPAGPEVSVRGPDGSALPALARGEVCMRGDSVTVGYADNPEANEAAFRGGWFHTGDEGYFDADGYLFLTGRIKEMINRGGEKIAPPEVDAVLLSHPSVAEAATFPVPDERLGEEVAAAVVLRAGAEASAGELRAFTAERLADFKVPKRIVLAGAIPKGPTGKIQRRTLAAAFQLDGAPTKVGGAEGPVSGVAAAAQAGARPPSGEVELRVAALFREVLRIEALADGLTFFELGGDSLSAARLLERARESFSVEVPFIDFFDAPTVNGLAQQVSRRLPPAAER